VTFAASEVKYHVMVRCKLCLLLVHFVSE